MAEDNIKGLENQFNEMVGQNGSIQLEDFKKVIHSQNSFFVERTFEIFDQDANGTISLPEFINAMHQFTDSLDSKIKFIFKVYDIDNDGFIQEKELQQVMKACMDENGMNFDQSEVNELANAFFIDATADEDTEGITLDAFKGQLMKHDGLLQNISLCIDRWLLPSHKKKNQGRCRQMPHHLSKQYIQNNPVKVSCVVVFILTNLVLFCTHWYTFWDFKNYDSSRNWWIILARAFGQCLNFTSVFILVLMLRHTITKLHRLAAILPLDRHILLHKITGRLIVIYSLAHTIVHLGNMYQNVLYKPLKFLRANGIEPNEYVINSELSWTDWLFTIKPHYFGLVSGYAYPTGVGLILVLLIMFLCSINKVRKSGHFEIFYFTHLLYVLYWILLILHAPNFWKWFIGPGILFLLEKIYGLARYHSNKGKTWVTTGVVLPSKVVSLVIHRPTNFTFKSGDYIFINIPAIASFEWHPFTISSAPEQSNMISLHIRAVGSWTQRLYEYFEAEQKRLECKVQGSGTCHDPEANQAIFHRTMTSVRRKVSRRRHSTSALKTHKKTEEILEDHAVQIRKSFKHMRKRPKVISYLPPEDDTGSVHAEMSEVIIESQVSMMDEGKEGTPNNLSEVRPMNVHDSGLEDDFKLTKPLVVYIDGPYGAPASQIFQAEHAVLIGTGIGVTPFASILQSIMHRYWQARSTCPKCHYKWTDDLSSSTVGLLKKVDFFWINRDQKSFEWFVNLLTQLEIEQAEQGGTMDRFLDMHLYITSALKKTDMKAVGLQLALDLLYKKSKRDLITGLKTRTNAGRPNWDAVFQELRNQRKGKITVFYCGGQQLGKILKLKCIQFGFDYRKENF